MAEKILPARRQTIILGSGGATVTGPASATNNEVAVFSGTTGRVIKVADGPITITAGGTNQNITLTPSGTGSVKVVGASETSWFGALTGAAAYGAITFAQATPSVTNFSLAGNGTNLALNAPTGGVIQFDINGNEKARFASSGNLLLSGLTTDGTGVLQFPAATTSAGGITFGTDINLYRSAAGNLMLDGSLLLTDNNSRYVKVGRFSAGDPYFYVSTDQAGAACGIRFQTGSSSGTTTALSLDSSQNATGVGYLNGSQVRILSKTQATTPYAVSATVDNRTSMDNQATTAMVTFTLPTAVAQLDYNFFVQDADGVTITANTGDTIRFGATVTAAAGSISSTTIGSSIRLRAINATEWVAVALVGTWA